jgi:LacI family transcriptional regulator
VVVRRADVARLAGTSPAVVSYVLNEGPRPVAPKTRARVIAAVEQLGYRPNGIARALRTNRTMTLGLVVPDTANPFFAEVARAVEDAAFAEGYTLLIGNANEDKARQTAYLRTFLDRQVDGLLVVPAGQSTGLAEVEQVGKPCVLVDRDLDGIDTLPRVLVDNRRGASLATGHLIEHGRRRICCIAGPAGMMPSTDRVAGWEEAIEQAGLPLGVSPIRHVPFGRHAGYRAALELVASHPVDAFFVASDEQALGALRAIHESGRRCPDDVAVVSFDGIAASAYSTPAVTTVVQPFASLGAVAVRRLLERMSDPSSPPVTSILPVRLQRRGSCGCEDRADRADHPGGESTVAAGAAHVPDVANRP